MKTWFDKLDLGLRTTLLTLEMLVWISLRAL
jgi:hypothetical protein